MVFFLLVQFSSFIVFSLQFTQISFTSSKGGACVRGDYFFCKFCNCFTLAKFSSSFDSYAHLVEDNIFLADTLGRSVLR